MASESRRIEWSHGPTDTRIGLTFAYVALGTLGGLVLFAVSMLLLGVAFAVAGGNFFAVGFIVLLALVGGPFSLLYLWPLIRHPEQRPPFPDWLGELRLQWVVLASLFGAFAIVHSAQFGFFFPVAGGLVSMVGLWLFTSEGEIDIEKRTLRYGYDIEIELDGLSGVKRFQIAGMMVLWLSFSRGRPPRLVVLPSETERIARPVFAEAAAQPAETHDPNRAVQAALVALALVFSGVPVVLLVSGSITTDGAAILGYIAVFFGLIFIGAAVYGT